MSFGYQVLGFGSSASGGGFDATGGTITEAGGFKIHTVIALLLAQKILGVVHLPKAA